MPDQNARSPAKSRPAKFSFLSSLGLGAHGQQNIDTIALLGITSVSRAASAMRRLGWSETDIRRWVGTEEGGKDP
jgi:hypothetical protein